MCTFLFCLVYCGYGTSALWDLWDWSIAENLRSNSRQRHLQDGNVRFYKLPCPWACFYGSAGPLTMFFLNYWPREFLGAWDGVNRPHSFWVHASGKLGGPRASVNWIIIGSGNNLALNRHQAISSSNANLLSSEPEKQNSVKFDLRYNVLSGNYSKLSLEKYY